MQLKSVPLLATEAIRAVAYILKKHEANEIAETITNQITNNLSPRIAEHVIAAITPQVVKILSTSESMDTTLKDVERLRTLLEREKEERRGEMTTAAEHFEEAVDALHKSMEECNKTLKSFELNLNKTQECIDELSLQLTSNPTQNNANTPSSNICKTSKPRYGKIRSHHGTACTSRHDRPRRYQQLLSTKIKPYLGTCFSAMIDHDDAFPSFDASNGRP
jgi:hypothetical protein